SACVQPNGYEQFAASRAKSFGIHLPAGKRSRGHLLPSLRHEYESVAVESASGNEVRRRSEPSMRGGYGGRFPAVCLDLCICEGLWNRSAALRTSEPFVPDGAGAVVRGRFGRLWRWRPRSRGCALAHRNRKRRSGLQLLNMRLRITALCLVVLGFVLG